MARVPRTGTRARVRKYKTDLERPQVNLTRKLREKETYLTFVKSKKIRFGAALLVIFALKFFDPQGLDHILSREAETRLSRVYAAWYPGAGCWQDCFSASGRDAVTVVLIDERTVRGLHRWPPSFESYVEMLNAIVSHHPRLIFLDLLIASRGAGTRDAEELGLFATALRKARTDSGVTVLIGQTDDALSSTCEPCPDRTKRLGGKTAHDLACAADQTVPIRWENDAGLIWYPHRARPSA